MTDEEKKIKEGMESAKETIKGLRLMVDTNVLIEACKKDTDQQDLIALICAQNETHISTTIFWEFLRDVGLDTFRKRFDFLVNNKDWFKTESEDEAVRKMYKAIWAVYLCVFKNDIRAMANRKIRDLWIVATAAQRGIEDILTFDTKDFPDKLFDKQKFYIGGDQENLFLLTINRRNIQGLLKEALDKGLQIPFLCFRE